MTYPEEFHGSSTGGQGGGGRTAISLNPLRKTAPSHSNKATQTEMDLALTVI